MGEAVIVFVAMITTARLKRKRDDDAPPLFLPLLSTEPSNNVSLQMEEQKFHVPALFLQHVSPVLGTFIDVATQEKKEKKYASNEFAATAVEIDVTKPNQALQDILKSMSVILHFDSSILTKENIFDILKAASYANMKPVVQSCEEWILDHLEAFSNEVELFDVAVTHHLEKLQSKVIQHGSFAHVVATSYLPKSMALLIERLANNYERKKVDICANCKKVKEPGSGRCARCMSVAYCSAECQLNHWRFIHKANCKERKRENEL